MLQFIKGLLGLGKAAEPERKTTPAGPYGLRLGLSAQVDLSVVKLDRESASMPISSESFVITGHGTIDGGLVHRFYDDDHRMLQVVCKDGNPAIVQEVALYQAWDEVVPVTAAEWDGWEGTDGKMRRATYDADGTVFERVWGEPSTRIAPLVEFTEEVTTEDGTKRLFQKTMSYRRRLPNGVTENLLVISVRDLDSNDRGSISFMVGNTLTVADVRPV